MSNVSKVELLRWNARRACGQWHEEVRAVLGTLHDAAVLERLGFTSFSLASAVEVNSDECWVQEEKDMMRRYYTLVIELASARRQVAFTSAKCCLPCIRYKRNIISN